MKKTLFGFLLLILTVFVISSCKLNDNNTSSPIASFGIVNVSPNAGNLDVYLNTTPIVYNLPYGTDTGYFSISPGAYTFMVDTTGSTAPRLNTSVSFTPGFTYSIFIIDSSSNLQVAQVEDNFTAPATDSADVRFFNFSPNSPAIDVAVSGNVLFSSRAYNDVSSNIGLAQFMTIAPGTYTVELRTAGTS